MPDEEVVPDDDAEHETEKEQVEETDNDSRPEDGPQPGEDPDALVVLYATDEEMAEIGDLDG